MRPLKYRIVNVFGTKTLGGNALCVFEDGSGLTDEQMQALALQFNLSETTFILPSEVASARVRIFTPGFEMPFAGHPTLGSAHVVRALSGAGQHVTLEMKAGIIPVTNLGPIWTLEARTPRVRELSATRTELSSMLGLDDADLAEGASWVDTGSEQLIVPLRSPDAVSRCTPDARLLAGFGRSALRGGHAYVFAFEAPERVVSRFFFLTRGALIEDPGTGSACANLGGFLIARASAPPLELTVRQGEHTGRECLLTLRVDAQKRIFVSGRVIEIGTGEIRI
jgi:trans-2,3-dihydro-3-hydroxyanthranilate isomerase